MSQTKETMRRLFISRSVAVLFGIQAALLLIRVITDRMGLEIAVLQYTDFISEMAFIAIAIPVDLTGYTPPIHPVTVFPMAFILFYIVAVIVAIPGRVVYRIGTEDLS